MSTPQPDYSTLSSPDIDSLISNSLSGDNIKISEATKFLKAYTKHKSSISTPSHYPETLTEILACSQDIAHRQMATVLLKANIVNLYLELTENERIEFRSLLLTRFTAEPSIAVQKGIATLIGYLLPVV
jgi:hypothetical protein